MKKVFFLAFLLTSLLSNAQWAVLAGPPNTLKTAAVNERVGLGNFAAASLPLARLHLSWHRMAAPTSNLITDGALFRTDGNQTLVNHWTLWTGTSATVQTERFRLYVPAASSDVRFRTYSTGSQIWETNGGSRIMTFNSSGDLIVGTLALAGNVDVANSTAVYRIAGSRVLSAFNGNTYCGIGTGTSTGSANVFLGYRCATNTSTGVENTIAGAEAGFNNTSGSANVLLGNRAGFLQVSASNVTALGTFAGENNLAGDNTFVGHSAGRNNTISDKCLFVGFNAGLNSDAEGNTMMGWNAGMTTTTGQQNTFVGAAAGLSNTIGLQNTIVGCRANGAGNPGNLNTIMGYGAGESNSSNGNTFIGGASGVLNVMGTENTFLGFNSGPLNNDGIYNTFLGSQAGQGIQTRSMNTHVGMKSGATGDYENSGAFGFETMVCESNTQRFGNDLVNGWGFGTCVDQASGHTFTINNGAYLTTGGVWTDASARDLKENIKEANGQMLLEKLQTLPILEWNYKTEDASVVHIGPMADDFYALFNYGNNDRGISAMDKSGIALAAIQELNYQLQEKTILLETTMAETETMKQRLSDMETALSQCCANFTAKNTNSQTESAWLAQNQPNPFSVNTSIRCFVPTGVREATIVIFSLSGENVMALDVIERGTARLEISAGSLAAGTYTYGLVIDGVQVDTKLMVISK